MKRTLFLISLASVVLIITIVVFVRISSKPVSISPYSAFSGNCQGLLVINDFQRAYKNTVESSLIWQEITSDTNLSSLSKSLHALDSLINNDDWISDNSEDITYYIGLHRFGQKTNFTGVIPSGNFSANSLKDCLERNANEVNLYGQFESIDIHEIQFKDPDLPPVYAASCEGLFIICPSPDMVETAINNILNEENLANDSAFTSVAATSGSYSDLNFFVNYSDPQALEMIGLSESEGDIKWAGWTALDATSHPDLFLLSGFTRVNENEYLSQFQKQKSQDVDVIQIIPDDVSMLIHFGLSNIKSYTQSKKELFEKTDKQEAYNQQIERLQQEYGLQLEDEFNLWVSNEFGVMYLPDPGISPTESKVAFFRLSDKKRTLSVLSQMADSDDDDLPKQIQAEKFLDHFEMKAFWGLDNPYFDVIDKYLVLSSFEHLIKEVKRQYLKANTLKKSEAYASFASNLSDQSNVYIYIRLNDGRKVLKDELTQFTSSWLEEFPESSEKIEQIGIQFKYGKRDLFYQHLAVNYNPKKRSQGKLLWEVLLDTGLSMKPQIVYNHYTNAREVFVQDLANTIYLIDNKGNILWKRQMKESVIGEVHQIDVYKNNKLQLLFSGESSVYLIDRKGRDVENFPIQLPAVANNALSVIDYEKNREYRILVPVRGGEILNFDRFGKPVKGWSYKSNDEIVFPIKYFLLNKKDYIVTANDEGEPVILNRRGESRMKISDKLPVSAHMDYSLELSNDLNQCKFVTTDASGNFIKLSFTGEKEVINLELLSDQHSFSYLDINNDRKNDYILLDSNRLMAFDHSKEKIFEVELEGESASSLNMYQLESGHRMAGLTDEATGKIYLYREGGGLDDNFPLDGETPFTMIDLNKDGRQNIIVGKGNRLLVYNTK